MLPNLGNSDLALVSIDEEERLGEAWLRSYHSRTPLVRDYLLQSYMEGLIFQLAPYANLPYEDIDVLVVDSPTINAFAVPGGIVGVNNGLLIYAETEDQLASVLAHELAHLSQRHFARTMAVQQRSGIAAMAGLLATIVIAATAGPDAGVAAMVAAQGATAESQLRYSRQNEQEADRVGQETLFRAGHDPAATVKMFETMYELTRLSGSRTPEYLLTHPLPESRLNDTASRAAQYPSRFYPVNQTYQLLRTRVQVANATRAEDALRTYSQRLEISPSNITAGYGYALALRRAGRLEEAYVTMTALRAREPGMIPLLISETDILLDQRRPDQAVRLLQDALRLRPGDHALTMQLALALNRDNRHDEAARLLTLHSRARERDPVVWYELAETRGLAGDILGVHLARAEYFLRSGQFGNAIQHLRLAIDMLDDNPIERAVLEERINQAYRQREQSAF